MAPTTTTTSTGDGRSAETGAKIVKRNFCLSSSLFQVSASAFLCGPITWPLAAQLLARQQGNATYQFSSLMRAQGMRRAFAGCGPYSCYKLLGMGIQRGIQAPVLTHMKANTDYSALTRYTVAGILSGVCGGLVVTPIEQFRISRANNDFGSTREMLRFFFTNGSHGAGALLTGTRITIYRNVLFDSVNCALYNMAIDGAYIDLLNPIQVGLCNAIVGVVTAVIDYPLDVLKARIQSSAVPSSFFTSRSSHSSPQAPFALMRHIITTEGPSALYGGLRHKLGLYFAVWGVYGTLFSMIGNLSVMMIG